MYLKTLIRKWLIPKRRDPILRSNRDHSAGETEAISARIQELAPWFHNMNLAKDVWTNPNYTGAGPDYPAWRWRSVEPLLGTVVGKNCLDVGCSSGFFSLKLKQLGAAEVVGIDSGEQLRATEQAQFAAECTGSAVDFRRMSVYEAGSLGRRFEVVLFLGVLYHLRHPLLALESLRRVTGERLILQTITTFHAEEGTFSAESLSWDPDDGLRSESLVSLNAPVMRFVEGYLDGDSSCWFVPTPSAVLAMLRCCGFQPEIVVFPSKHEMIVSAYAGTPGGSLDSR